jgi:hypothetical protein
MAWAEATAYSEAVQNPRVAFGDAELQAGELATNQLGLPLVHTGNFAAVFQMRRPAGPPDWALKCFTRQVHGLRRRYQAIHTHLNGRRLSQMWLKLSVMLREAEVGHGDLQHGNVLLVPVPGTDNLALKLIDYDGMYVPELAGHPPGEIGHPAY